MTILRLPALTSFPLEEVFPPFSHTPPRVNASVLAHLQPKTDRYPFYILSARPSQGACEPLETRPVLERALNALCLPHALQLLPLWRQKERSSADPPGLPLSAALGWLRISEGVCPQQWLKDLRQAFHNGKPCRRAERENSIAKIGPGKISTVVFAKLFKINFKTLV